MAEEATGSKAATDRSEGFGERLLGTLIDRAHEMPPHLIAPLIAQEVASIGGRDVTVLLQDYDQHTLMPLPGKGLTVGEPEPIRGSSAGQAFLSDATVEQEGPGGVRLFVPLLDGSDRVGVIADSVNDDDRRLARRLAGLVADMLVTKGGYTDRFFQARRRHPMSLPAEMQWQLLPPLMMATPQVSVAGMLEPVYDVAGDSFDYALNDDCLHVCIFDAMGHGLEAAVLAMVAVGAYRHARRADVGLEDLYAGIDAAIAGQFGEERFLTAQMATLDVVTGQMRWVNAGHPAPLLIRGGRVVRTLTTETTLPIGFGGTTPVISEVDLERGDRVLFFTDGITEEHTTGGEPFGEARLARMLERAGGDVGPVQETVRWLSHALMVERGGVTSDDATLLLVEWRGGAADHLAEFDEW